MSRVPRVRLCASSSQTTAIRRKRCNNGSLLDGLASQFRYDSQQQQKQPNKSLILGGIDVAASKATQFASNHFTEHNAGRERFVLMSICTSTVLNMICDEQKSWWKS
jgi:hypothetical protein